MSYNYVASSLALLLRRAGNEDVVQASYMFRRRFCWAPAGVGWAHLMNCGFCVLRTGEGRVLDEVDDVDSAKMALPCAMWFALILRNGKLVSR